MEETQALTMENEGEEERDERERGKSDWEENCAIPYLISSKGTKNWIKTRVKIWECFKIHSDSWFQRRGPKTAIKSNLTPGWAKNEGCGWNGF